MPPGGPVSRRPARSSPPPLSSPRPRRAKRAPAETRRAAAARSRKQEVAGLVLIALGLLLGIAVASHHPADDALLASDVAPLVTDFGDNRFHNLIGHVGAWTARGLVSHGLGFPVLLPVAFLVAWGWVLLRRKTPVFLPLLSALAVAGAVFIAAFFGWLDLHAGTGIPRWSGAIGGGLAAGLSSIAGATGAFVILVVGVLVTALLLVDLDIQTSLERAETAAASVRTGLAEAWAGYREGAAERRALRAEARETALADRAARRDARAASAPPPPSRPRRSAADEHPDGARADGRDTEAPAGRYTNAPPPSDRLRDEPRDVTAEALARSADAARSVLPAVPPSAPPSLADDADDPDLDALVDEVAGPAVHVIGPAEVEKVDLDAERRIAPDAAALPYDLPSIELLEDADGDPVIDYEEIEENKQTLLDKLQTYNIEITEIDAVVGPTVTRYELTPAPGIKISRITALEDDLAMALAAPGIRIIAPIPGKSAIGVEIPNRSREMVRLRQMLSTATFRDAARAGKMALPAPIGKTIEGDVFIEDLAKTPHLLIAGATGSGKSVGLNAIIVGLLYAKHPADLKFVMIDPKQIELNAYRELLNHYSAMPEDADEPVITDFSQAAAVLRSCVEEMNQRYTRLAEAGVRGIEEYNAKLASGALKGLGPEHKRLPYIVVIVDELADLMMTSAKEVEAPIARLAQMARAVGIHLVLATQRPSVDVITGLIKANFPSRLAYQVASRIDSRTIIDGGGAQHLIGNGDLLYMSGSRITRLQGPFVSVREVEAVAGFVGKQEGAGPYLLPPMNPMDEAPEGAAGTMNSDERDDLFEEAARIIVRSQQGSVSLLQRKLSIGYTRAARLVDQLEDAGIVGPFEGSKAREVLVHSEHQLDAMIGGATLPAPLGDEADEI